MYCGKCGAEIMEGALFCARCGTSVSVSSTMVVPAKPIPDKPIPAEPVQAGNCITEYRCVCNNCGSMWNFTDADMRANKKLKAGAYLNALNAGIQAADGRAIGGAMWANRADGLATAVRDFNRCPTCGSYDITKESKQIQLAFGGDAGNAAYSGGKSKVVAGLLGIFLGVFGAHKFYLGYMKQGVILLAVSVLGCILLGIPTVVVSLLGIVEGVIYLTKSPQDFDNTYVKNEKPWF